MLNIVCVSVPGCDPLHEGCCRMPADFVRILCWDLSLFRISPDFPVIERVFR